MKSTKRQHFDLKLFYEGRGGVYTDDFFIQELDTKGNPVATNGTTDWWPYHGGLWLTTTEPKVTRGISFERDRSFASEIYPKAAAETTEEKQEFADETVITGKLATLSDYWHKLSLFGRNWAIPDMQLRISGSGSDDESAYFGVWADTENASAFVAVEINLSRERLHSLANQILTSNRALRINVGLLQIGGLFQGKDGTQGIGVIKILTPRLAESVELPEEFPYDLRGGTLVKARKFNLELIFEDDIEKGRKARTFEQLKEEQNLSMYPPEKIYRKPAFWWITIPALIIGIDLIGMLIDHFAR